MSETSNKIPMRKIGQNRQRKVSLLSEYNSVEDDQDGSIRKSDGAVDPDDVMQQDDANVGDSGSGETWFWNFNF